jgi:diguanylate cyclase
MRLPAFFSSLKFRLIAVAVATGVLTAAGTSKLLLDATGAGLRTQLLRLEREDAERTAELLGGKLETLKRALVAVAARTDRSTWKDRQAMERFLIDKPALHTLFDGLLAATPDGRTLLRMERGQPTPERPNVADRAYFQKAMQTDQPVVSDPLIGRVSKQALVILAVQAVGADGTPLGVVAGVVSLQSNSLFSDSRVHSRSDGTVDMVVDRRGVVLAHPDPARLLAPTDQLAGVAGPIQRWRDDGSPIDLDGRAELTDGYLVARAGIPSSDWMHLRVTPQALALQPLQDAHHEAWRAAALAGALAALLAGSVGWWSVRPIARLRQRALSLLANEDDAGTTWRHGRDELGDMGRAFEQLLSERRGRQAEQQALLVQVESVLDHADVGIALSVNSHFVLVSRRLCQILRCERADLIGEPTRLLHASASAYDALKERAGPAFTAQGVFECEIELVRRDGQSFWARMRGRAVVPGDMSAGTIWVIEDVTDSRQQRESLTWSASHDALTGLHNRAAFEARLEAAVTDPRQHPFCALFIDLDRFKQVNDTAGHAAGDALLQGVANALSGCVRRDDVVSRLGGDEFAVLLPQCPAAKGRLIAEKLCAAVEAYALEWQGATHHVGASVGLAIGNGNHANAAEVLREADAYCYAAKRAGRNRVVSVEETPA